MKIRIKAERYYLTPKPQLTRAMFDYLYDNWWKVKNHLYDRDLVVKTIEIRINQALSWMDYHFYITINGNRHIHLSASAHDFEKFQKQKLDYETDESKKGWGAEYVSRKAHFTKYVINNRS